jgi:hypothetical protein
MRLDLLFKAAGQPVGSLKAVWAQDEVLRLGQIGTALGHPPIAHRGRASRDAREEGLLTAPLDLIG